MQVRGGGKRHTQTNTWIPQHIDRTGLWGVDTHTPIATCRLNRPKRPVESKSAFKVKNFRRIVV